ncbi:MAG: substrate-binding domain-containing protein, partial [Actinobacteria bacterium]|nr:substrate-binding domain-containing protein [Actinomycetota bacterium]
MKKCVVLLLIIAFTVSMMVIAIGCKEETVEETTAAEITEAETTAAETTGAETTTAEKALKIGISFPVIDHPYFLEIDSGFDAAEKEFNVVYIKTDAQLDVNKQLSDVEDLVTQQVEGLIAMPLDPTSIIPAIETANNAGIPVVTVDLGAAGGEIAAHVASDNYEGGRLVAQFLIEQLGGKGNLVCLEGVPTAESNTSRVRGFKEEISKYPEINLVASQPSGTINSKEEGLNTMENMLQANPVIDGVFAINDELAVGVAEAIKSAGREGIIIVGFDANEDGLDAIRKGDIP